MHLTHPKDTFEAFSMFVYAWHLLLPIFLCFADVYCDGTEARVKLFPDAECSQAEISTFQAQLNFCIVIPGAVGVMIETFNPCDDGFIFITGYSDSSCMRGITNQGPNNTIPNRCFSGGVFSPFAAIQVYCIAEDRPLSTITLSATTKTPSSITALSDVSVISFYTTTTLSIAPNTFSSSITTLLAISETLSSSTATAHTAPETPPALTTTAKPSSEAHSPSATTVQTVSATPSSSPTTTAGGSGGSNTSSGLSDNGKVAVGVSIGVSAAALVVGFLTWLFPNPCNRRRHSSVDEDQPDQHRRHRFSRPRPHIFTGQYSSRHEMNSSLASD